MGHLTASRIKRYPFYEMVNTNINELIATGHGNALILVTLDDLKAFAMELANNLRVEETKCQEEDELMTRQQVMDYLRIRPTTLWNWEKKNLLVPTKIGRKSYYSKSDILALQRGEVAAG